MTRGPVKVRELVSGLAVWLKVAMIPPGATAEAGGMLDAIE